MSQEQTLRTRAAEFQHLADNLFRDADDLPVMAVHESGRPLTAADVTEEDYNRPPHAGAGPALLWHQYENTNMLMGLYLLAQAERIRAGDPGGRAAGRAMLAVLFEAYFRHGRRLEPGLLGKPIVFPGGMAAYDHAVETNADQLSGIFRGLHAFAPFARRCERELIAQMATEIVDYLLARDYDLEVRGRTIQGRRGIHSSVPMMFLAIAHRFDPTRGYWAEYERWFELARREPAVNASCRTYLNYLSVTGQLDGDQEVYFQGVWDAFVSMIGKMADLDPSRRGLFRTRLREWWDETHPLLTEDGRITWSMMVTPETRRWRTMRPGEIERGPYSCWWGAPVFFSGQAAACGVGVIAQHWPDLKPSPVMALRNLLVKTTRERLKWCWPMPGYDLPANLGALSRELYHPCDWLIAYWSARAEGLIED